MPPAHAAVPAAGFEIINPAFYQVQGFFRLPGIRADHDDLFQPLLQWKQQAAR